MARLKRSPKRNRLRIAPIGGYNFPSRARNGWRQASTRRDQGGGLCGSNATYTQRVSLHFPDSLDELVQKRGIGGRSKRYDQGIMLRNRSGTSRIRHRELVGRER